MKKVAALLLLVLASVALVACGGSSSSSTSSGAEGGAATGGATKAEGTGTANSGGGASIAIETDPSGELAYTTKSVTAKAGDDTVDFTNSQELSHDVAIEDSSGKIVGKTELVASGSASTAVKLKPGTYHYFCTVPGHREAGMEGTLTVK
jgi:plastocyanin